jgi:hypothetical protein
MSSNEMAKKQDLVNLDGFDSFSSEVEGEASSTGSRVIQGTKLSFTLMCTWDPPIEVELLAADMGRYVQKWSPDNRPLDDCLSRSDRGNRSPTSQR